MSWTKVMLGTKAQKEQLFVVGECNRCYQCCVCWIYDRPDQPAGVLPKRGWCPNLDLEGKVCRIWDSRPEGCRNFPTVRDFELGTVPETCGFRLTQGGNTHG